MTQYKVSYRYAFPSSAGPFKGKTETIERYKKGDTIRAPFGTAIVVSCREKKS